MIKKKTLIGISYLFVSFFLFKFVFDALGYINDGSILLNSFNDVAVAVVILVSLFVLALIAFFAVFFFRLLPIRE